MITLSMNNKIIKKYKKLSDIDFLLKIISYVSTNKTNENYIYGGYVRNFLRDEDFNDIDICFVKKNELELFKSILEISNRIIESHFYENSLQYQFYSINIISPNNNKIKIDLSHGNNIICDFTCNNLIYSSDNKIYTRTKPPLSLKIDKNKWLKMCIRDCIDGKISIIHPPIDNYENFNNISIMFKLKKRYDKLINIGFTEGTNLSGFKFKLPKSVNINNIINKNCINCKNCKNNNCDNCDNCNNCDDCKDYMCAICHENYDNNCDTVICACNHHFHWDCLKTWTIKNETCPLCRKNIKILF